MKVLGKSSRKAKSSKLSMKTSTSSLPSSGDYESWNSYDVADPILCNYYNYISTNIDATLTTVSSITNTTQNNSFTIDLFARRTYYHAIALTVPNCLSNSKYCLISTGSCVDYPISVQFKLKGSLSTKYNVSFHSNWELKLSETDAPKTL